MSENYTVSTSEIKELALRYLDESELIEIPESGDLFCFFQRELPEDRDLKENEGWHFGGYGVCNHYLVDGSEKPAGKWIIFNFTSLASFPPQKSELRLQPPHIAKGSFTSPDRTFETKLVKIDQKEEELENEVVEELDTTILSFPTGKN